MISTHTTCCVVVCHDTPCLAVLLDGIRHRTTCSGRFAPTHPDTSTHTLVAGPEQRLGVRAFSGLHHPLALPLLSLRRWPCRHTSRPSQEKPPVLRCSCARGVQGVCFVVCDASLLPRCPTVSGCGSPPGSLPATLCPARNTPRRGECQGGVTMPHTAAQRRTVLVQGCKQPLWSVTCRHGDGPSAF